MKKSPAATAAAVNASKAPKTFCYNLSMPSFTQAIPSDLSTLLALQREFYAGENLPHTPAVANATTHLLDDDSLGQIILIHTNTTPVGYLVLTHGYSLERAGRIALLDELFILPAHRNQGLGKAAIAHAIDLAKENHCHSLHLEADHKNTRAPSLYLSLGFTPVSRHYLTRPIDPAD